MGDFRHQKGPFYGMLDIYQLVIVAVAYDLLVLLDQAFLLPCHRTSNRTILRLPVFLLGALQDSQVFRSR